MSDNRPIGVIDSGLGGLTVVNEIFRLMPLERVLYLGDTARCPYGERSESIIKSHGLQEALFITKKDIKLLIVACNTISSVAFDSIKNNIKEIPVIGVIHPTCKAAAMRTAEKKIGVIGTTATIKSEKYRKELTALNPLIRVYSKECPLFVSLVEEGLYSTDICHMVAQYYLYELVDIGIDCLILGCTHYPLLLEVIQSTVSSRVELIDCAMWTAKEARNILNALDARVDSDINGLKQSRFFITDFSLNLEKIAARLLGSKIFNIELIQINQLNCLTV